VFGDVPEGVGIAEKEQSRGDAPLALQNPACPSTSGTRYDAGSEVGDGIVSGRAVHEPGAVGECDCLDTVA
jgi:hypothetical protein